MNATIEALKGLHAALIADGFDPGVDAFQLSELVADGLSLLDPLDEEGDAEEKLTCACERASAGVRRALRNWPTPPAVQTTTTTTTTTTAPCGHSACRQNYIDTEETHCVAPLWDVTLHVIRSARVRALDEGDALRVATEEDNWDDEDTGDTFIGPVKED